MPDKQKILGLTKVRQVLAVASGKGGVGKTTIAVNALRFGPSGKKRLALQASCKLQCYAACKTCKMQF